VRPTAFILVLLVFCLAFINWMCGFMIGTGDDQSRVYFYEEPEGYSLLLQNNRKDIVEIGVDEQVFLEFVEEQGVTRGPIRIVVDEYIDGFCGFADYEVNTILLDASCIADSGVDGANGTLLHEIAHLTDDYLKYEVNKDDYLKFGVVGGLWLAIRHDTQKFAYDFEVEHGETELLAVVPTNRNMIPWYDVPVDVAEIGIDLAANRGMGIGKLGNLVLVNVTEKGNPEPECGFKIWLNAEPYVTGRVDEKCLVVYNSSVHEDIDLVVQYKGFRYGFHISHP